MKGIVLAGGRSSRFGENKALAQIDGQTLLERMAGLLTRCGFEAVVLASHQQDYSDFGLVVKKDLVPAKGPLGGLYSACVYFKNESLLVLTCDMPAVDETMIQTLRDTHERKDQVTVFNSEDRLQPFPGVYESKLSNVLLQRIKKNELRVQDFLISLTAVKKIYCEGIDKKLLNVNQKEDLANFSG